jgi:hypothetical protein
MDNKELESLGDLKDLIVYGRLEKAIKIVPPGEDGPPMEVVVQSMTSREKRDLHEKLRDYLDKGPYLFGIVLEEHILANIVKSINGRTWNSFDEALAFFGSLQERFRTFLYQECYEKVIGEQDKLYLENFAGKQEVEKLKNLYSGDSLKATSGSPLEDTGTS